MKLDIVMFSYLFGEIMIQSGIILGEFGLEQALGNRGDFFRPFIQPILLILSLDNISEFSGKPLLSKAFDVILVSLQITDTFNYLTFIIIVDVSSLIIVSQCIIESFDWRNVMSNNLLKSHINYLYLIIFNFINHFRLGDYLL
jgi:hypothetical protein